MSTITRNDFEKVHLHVGTIQQCSLIDGAKYSTHHLTIDFGQEIGIKKSCARLIHYTPEQLIGRQILAVTNFPPKQIGKRMSEVLCLGLPDENNETILIAPDSQVQNGVKVY